MIKNILPFVVTMLFGCLPPAFGETGASLRDQLQVDTSQINRVDHRGGYSSVVEKVSPSVVSIFTSSRVNPPSKGLYRDLFDDPFFRFFFDQPFDKERDRAEPDLEPNPLPQIRKGLGSGVILTSDGYIATNNHVVEGAEEIQVKLQAGKEEYKAKVIGRDRATDLALLKIEASDLPFATLGDSSTAKVGDTVLAIGNPFGLSQTVTSGIVSGLGRKNLYIVGYENFIQTDASINPGNSGGALVDNEGRVIGINTAIVSRSGGNVGIGFAIPSNMAVEILDRLLVFGEVRRGYLGVTLSNLTPELAEGFGVEANGVLVNDVMKDTPAEKAGLESGDIITKYDGTEVVEMSDLRLQVANTKPGTRVDIEVIRKGKKEKLSIEVGRIPADMTSSPGRARAPGSSQSFIPGVEINDLNEENRSFYGIPDDTEGVLVTRVEPNSDADMAGLRRGDVITSVSQRKVSSVKEAVEAHQKTKGKITLLQVTNKKGTKFIAVEKQ